MTDLYSLGCILYRLTCGRPVFRPGERSDLLYFHVAIEPKSPSARSRHIPQPLSDVILRLLKKNAEERYQSAHGVLADIEELLGRWQAGLQLEALPFVMGESDYPTRLVIPTFIVGRAHELGVLRETCESASRNGGGGGGGLHVVMLKGGSGAGKSKLLMETRRWACSKRAIFACAKFDQYKRGLPFSAYITLLRSFVNVCLPPF
jgi:hypothetical protein